MLYIRFKTTERRIGRDMHKELTKSKLYSICMSYETAYINKITVLHIEQLTQQWVQTVV